MVSRFKIILPVAFWLVAGCASASAESLTFKFVNPSFGGNPFNSGHLLAIAGAQKPKEKSGSGLGSSSLDRDPFDLFLQQLQSRLLSGLARQVTEAIFGDNPQDSGTITFDTQEITFDRTGESINLTITNLLDGTITTISVPTLSN